MQPNLQATKRVLESKLKEITNPAEWRESIAVSASADPTDITIQIAEREMASRSLSRDASLVRDLRAEMNRLSDGTYGLCVECEEPIAPRRQAAVPWAARCLSCQGEMEMGSGQFEQLAA